ncbi:MAG TPA: HAMP domain-containing sensor histidine kinase [Bacteroidales bacterium]|nr:HAMP domain-containing sensor histidine kinase [Bacteroidales bacterium]
MNLYTRKRKWKWILFVSASIMFLLLMYYSNTLVKGIAEEERRKVKIWADAITYKAEIVSHTDQFFETIRKEEKKRASLLAQAIRKVSEADIDEEVTFYLNFISSNSTIPTIIVNENGKIDACVNVDDSILDMKNIDELGSQIEEFDIIKVPFYKSRFIYVYYKESQIYSNLRILINDLVQSFFQEVVINEASTPVIITDFSKNNIIAFGHIDTTQLQSEQDWINLIHEMEDENRPIKIELPQQGTCYVMYKESTVLTRLRYFPYIQFFFIFVFIIIAYIVFSFARKSEQDRVWVGMSKETAHQLGTPISSLLAWYEILKEQNVDSQILKEIKKDLNRLETIAQRFSKIGSIAELEEEDVIKVIHEFVSYLQTRLSSKVEIKITSNTESLIIPLNRYLFEWVIENICKNSVDSMDGNGVIIIDVNEEVSRVNIDITDTGKGIPPQRFKQIFKPGFTSKKRGWGLGLTLAKRIIETYHKGKIFVKSSTLERGTTMRIQLKKGSL